MYNIGDKVVCPMHGAGIIEAIEERSVLGEKKQYYVLTVVLGNIRIMIPTDSDKTGLRDVIDAATADKVIDFIGICESEEENNWNRRYRENMERIKTGDIFEVAAVVKSLMKRDRLRGLSTGERKMLNDTRHILISELVLAKDSDETLISDTIEKLVFDEEEMPQNV